MLPIQGLPPPKAASGPRRSASAGAWRFDVTAESVPGDAASRAWVGAGEVGLTGMLALQETAEQPAATMAAARERQAQGRGRDTLDALAALQRDLLGGAGPSTDTLHRLAALACGRPDVADHGLQRILAEIRLRAIVELARYGLM